MSDDGSAGGGPRSRYAFVQTCMGRAHHVRKTLPHNLEAIEGRDFHILLLDYNSRDGLEDWVRDECAAWIDDGRLVYARTTRPDLFRVAHAKNVATLLGDATVVSNLDADQFVSEAYVDLIEETFGVRCPIVMRPDWEEDGYSVLCGRITVFKEDFVAAGGYEESYVGYCAEDLVLVRRLMTLGVELVTVSVDVGGWIDHGWEERIENMDPAWFSRSKLVRASDEGLARSYTTHAFMRGVVDLVRSADKRANVGRRWGAEVVEINFGGAAEVGHRNAPAPPG